MTPVAVLVVVLGLAVTTHADVVQNAIKFYLYNKASQLIPRELTIDQPVKAGAFDELKTLKVLVHGWIDNSSTFFYKGVRDAYWSKGDANVICIDWGVYANSKYKISSDSAVSVGKIVASVIIKIADALSINYSDIHLIGFSLGAHISAFAGKEVIKQKGVQVGRITGLDPAGPLFDSNPKENRICAEDAEFVDIIHTDAGILGSELRLGDADFYPNGGKQTQPGCDALSLGCNHIRAPELFIETIKSDKFIGVQCETYFKYLLGFCNNNNKAIMGENVSHGARGTFYLKTTTINTYDAGL